MSLCYPVGPDDLAAAVASPDALDRDPPLQALAAFVASEGEDVLGFIQAGVQPPEHAGGAGLGMIRFFWYEAGRRAVGQALLEAAEAHGLSVQILTKAGSGAARDLDLLDESDAVAVTLTTIDPEKSTTYAMWLAATLRFQTPA